MKDRNQLISHLRTIFCALAIIGLPLAFPSAEASGPPLPASGGFFPCFTYAGPPRQVGENLIITFNITGTVTGTFTGSFTGAELDIVHRDVVPTPVQLVGFHRIRSSSRPSAQADN